jgi:hypothetical protein
MSTAAVSFEAPISRREEVAGKPGVVRFLRMPEHRFVMIDGEGPPAESAFVDRMPGLYATAYSLRFALKKRGVVEKVGLLEGLWWTTDGTTDLDAIFGPGPGTGDEAERHGDRSTWRWTLMIGLPDQATPGELTAALETGRGRLASPLAAALRVERFAEGDVAQLLHVGPYAEERPSIERLHAAIHEAGLQAVGRHHELYVGDPQRSAPARLRTILRQPVAAR